MTPTEIPRPRTVVREREITITRLFEAPRALVFAAWTDPRLVERWWGPSGLSGFGCEIDPRVGGVFQIHLRGPDGLVYPCRGVFREIVVPERIVYAGPDEESPGCGAGLPPRSLVTVKFAEIEGRTEVTIHTQMESIADREAARQAGYTAGWESSLERLEGLMRQA